MGGKPLILESKIDFVAEASFLIARDAAGRVEHFPATMNHHINGILATSTAPAPLDEAILQKGYDAIENMARHLDLCGILAMESFMCPTDGTSYLMRLPRARIIRSTGQLKAPQLANLNKQRG